MMAVANSDKLTFLGLCGAAAAALLGGWDGSMLTLCIFMLADYISGIVLAAVFRKSNKSKTGALESRAGLKGLCRKAGMMVVVIVGVRLDLMCGMDGVLRTGVIFALVANEALSVIENLGLMGVPLPKALVRAIEQLRGRNPEMADRDDE